MNQNRPQSILDRVVRDGRQLMIKTATHEGRQELLDQASFYMTIPPELRPIYPRVLELSVSDDHCVMTTPYYAIPALTEAVLYSSRGAKDIGAAVLNILRRLSVSQYGLVMRRAGASYLQSTYIERIRKRFERTRKLDPVLRHFIEAESLVVNGVRYLGMNAVLAELELRIETQDYPTPEWLILTHGQLRFDHILYDFDREAPSFVLLEPRGYLEPRDIGYELGKIEQCLGSKILWIERHEFSMSPPNFKDKEAVIVRFSLAQRAACEKADAALGIIREGIESAVSREYLYDGYQRVVRLAEATHTCGGAPFFYHEDNPEIAYAYFVLGTIMLNAIVDSAIQLPEFLQHKGELA